MLFVKRAVYAFVIAAVTSTIASCAAFAGSGKFPGEEPANEQSEYLEPDDGSQEGDESAIEGAGADKSREHVDEDSEDETRAVPCGGKIIGGCTSRPGSWPSFVQVGSGNFSFCGGTVIAKNWVLTAAHCVSEAKESTSGCVRSKKAPGELEIYEASEATVVGGQKPRRKLEVAEVIPHERYTGDCGPSTMQFDVALLRLRDAAQSPPAVLAGDRSIPLLAPPGKLATVIGVGVIKFPGSDRPKKLMQVDVPIISEETCRHAASSKYNAQTIDYRTQLCAGFERGGKDSCKGDSGGPLFSRDRLSQPVQVGVVSWGIGCADAKNWGVYASVGRMEQWVRNHAPDAQFTGEGDGAQPQLETALQQVVADHENLTPSQLGEVSIKVLPGPQVKIGQPLQVAVTSSISGKLIVLNQDETGKTTQLFPNNFSTSTSGGIAKEKIDAGVPVVIPGAGDSFTLLATPPAARNTIIAIVTPINAKLSDVTDPGKTLRPLSDPSGLIREVAERSGEADHERGVKVEGNTSSTRAVGRLNFEIIP